MSDESAAKFELDLYADMYRCQSCADLTSPLGVGDFAAVGPRQTVPVSHFGNITRSPIWLILNNPANDRQDVAVGTTPAMFGAASRAALGTEAIRAIKTRLDHYFDDAATTHEFFDRWVDLLSGIALNGEVLTFANGTICAVDLIKCPTVANWMGYVMKPEGKQVWDRCLRGASGNRFLIRQIELHRPPVLVFAGTANCVKSPWRGKTDRHLKKLAKDLGSILIADVWTNNVQRRISIGLGSQREIKKLELVPDALGKERRYLQTVLDVWSSGR